MEGTTNHFCRNLYEKKIKFVEQPTRPAPDPETADPDTIEKYYEIVNLEQEVACIMLSSMSPDLQRTLEKYNAYDMLKELKTMFEEHAKQELFEIVKAFHACKQEEGQSVCSYLLKMKSYLDTLECLGYAMPNELGTIAELHAMLKLHEKGILKKAETPTVLAIREGKIQNDKKKPRGAKGKDKGKNKLSYAPKPKIPPPPKRYNLEKDSGLRERRKLKHGALSLYMGNGMCATVRAIGSFDLILPSGLIIVLDNCHFAPSIMYVVRSILKYLRNTKDMVLVCGEKLEAELKYLVMLMLVFRQIRRIPNPKRDMCSYLMVELWTGRVPSKALLLCLL
ncbi:hypothetical protein Tco_1191389 [Tanacetum coccineum]